MRLSQHFTLDEFTFSQTATRLGIDNDPPPDIVARMISLCEEVLEPLRAELDRPIIITSGYRSPELNRVIGGSPRSQHCKGEAADIVVPGLSPLEVCRAVKKLGRYDQLIHEFGRWCHVSWRGEQLSRRETLTAMHRDGRVVYLRGLVEV